MAKAERGFEKRYSGGEAVQDRQATMVAPAQRSYRIGHPGKRDDDGVRSDGLRTNVAAGEVQEVLP